MIEVNLLPEELRAAEKTPLPRLLTIYAGVTLWCLALVLWVWLHFTVKEAAKAELERNQKTEREKAAEAREFDELQGQLTALDVKVATVNSLLQGRLIWAEKIQQLVEFLQTTDAWISSISVETGAGGGVTLGMELKLTGQGTLLSDWRLFLDKLGKSEFWKDFKGKPEEYYPGLPSVSKRGTDWVATIPAVRYVLKGN